MSLTRAVPAAACCTAFPPAAVKLNRVPEALSVLAQSVRGQVTDLQPGKLTLELLKRHPVRKK